ncbi:hypothetical protein Sam46_gp33 [Bacillus phage vB_BcM_Sam46]|uniref:Uncharacterized protein n=1 Tax=Bacillus phage vB_BcM_Sam46 TaxID=2719179 RepID=A0A6G9L9D1_9CAUD|nr:hypothetical protein Sam46_gp33 [Bacillus phage vB_BcM_Sam46]
MKLKAEVKEALFWGSALVGMGFVVVFIMSYGITYL